MEQDNKPTFKDAAAAVAWAEEVLDKQGARSQLRKLLKRIDGEYTADEARDYAHTIVMIVSRYPHKLHAEAFSYVYGRHSAHRERILTEELAVRMAAHIAAGGHKPKPVIKLRTLAAVVLDAQRDVYLNCRHHPLGRIASIVDKRLREESGGRVGFSASLLRGKATVWPELYGETRSTVRHWVDEAGNGLNDLLRERGFVV